MTVHQGAFGSCCEDLHDAVERLPESFFHVEDNGVLYMTVGYMRTVKGLGFFGQALIF